MFQSLESSGMLDKLITDGKEYLFVSNIDNLGATVDTSQPCLIVYHLLSEILQRMHDTDAEFIMETTTKTKSDIKGTNLIEYNGTLQVVEPSQIPTINVSLLCTMNRLIC